MDGTPPCTFHMCLRAIDTHAYVQKIKSRQFNVFLAEKRRKRKTLLFIFPSNFSSERGKRQAFYNLIDNIFLVLKRLFAESVLIMAAATSQCARVHHMYLRWMHPARQQSTENHINCRGCVCVCGTSCRLFFYFRHKNLFDIIVNCECVRVCENKIRFLPWLM